MNIPYRPGVSMIHLTGTLDTKAHREKETITIRRSSQVDVAVTCEADTDCPLSVSLPPDHIADTSVTLNFADGERLSGIGFESTGKLGEVISSMASLVGSIAAAVIRAAPVAAAAWVPMADGTPPVEPESPKERYLSECREHAQRRSSVNEAIGKLDAAITDAANSIARARTPASDEALATRVKRLSEVRDRLEAELEDLETHFRTWLAATYERSEPFERHLTFSRVTPMEGEEPLWLGEEAGSKPWPETTLFPEAGVAVFLQDSHPTNPESPSDREDVIRFRRPREARLLVYALTERETGSPWYRLRKRMTVQIVDEYSPYLELPLDRSVLNKHTLSVETTAAGSVSKVQVAASSFLESAAAALSGIPDKFSTGLDTATKVSDTVGKLRDAAMQRHISELEDRKKLLEDDIAYSDLVSNRALNQELTRVKAELDLAKKKKELLDAGG